MQKFECEGSRPVFAASMKEAASVFAARIARRTYGRSAYARTLRCELWTQSGTWASFESFVGVDRREFYDHHGRPTGSPVCVGSNVTFTVRAA